MYLQATCICECLEMRLQWAKEEVEYTYRAALLTLNGVFSNFMNFQAYRN